MVPRPKRELARDHLDLALEELEEENFGLVVTLLLHSSEAAIDALADDNSIPTSAHHWRREQIVEELEQKGVLESSDGAKLVRVLNEDRKAYAYDGRSPHSEATTFTTSLLAWRCSSRPLRHLHPVSSELRNSGWNERMATDRSRATKNQTAELRAITDEVLSRARRANALAFALTGSTARARRTAISDLDYHLVGEGPDLQGLPADVDLVADSLERFQRRLAENDDFVHWTLRHGCVLYDPHDLFGDAYLRIRDSRLWPDPRPKVDRALELGVIAEKVLSIGDRDAGQEHIRGGLTSLARGVLLESNVFPLARAELGEQLREVDHRELAEWLDRTIYERPEVEELRDALAALRRQASLAEVGIESEGLAGVPEAGGS